ncbi:MAG: response regulator [Planctomycetota bacterium]
MNGKRVADAESERERALAAEIVHLRQQLAAVRKERDDVATANAHAALQMASMFERRRKDLDEQRRALQDALDRLEVASRRKDEFLAKISHELRTPLNGILGTAQLLYDSLTEPLDREHAGITLSSAQALLAIFDDLLDLSKAQAGSVRLRDDVLDTWALCGNVIKLLTARGAQASVRLRCAVDPRASRWVRGDEQRLRQILVNLCGNALKFTERGEVVLRCRPGAAGRLRFEVIDTGCGIPKDALDEVFESFRQLDNTSARAHGGAGLGLAVTKGLVEAMGGDITLVSTVGRGSTFAFELGLPVVESRPPRPHFSRVRLVGGELESDVYLVRHLAALGVPASQDVRGAARGELAILAPGADADAGLVALSEELQERGVEVAWLLPATGSERDVPARVIPLCPPLCAHELVDLVAGGRLEQVPAPFPSSRTPTRALRLLVVEDNAVNQLVATRLLERLGYAVEVASSGPDALERLASRRFDGVLMDCQMPGMDGYEATRRIRATERGAKLPIVALTANAMDADRERCLEVGMDDFLAKPIDVHELEKVLERALDRTASRA